MEDILEDLGLRSRLRVDVFDPHLGEYTTSTQERYSDIFYQEFLTFAFGIVKEKGLKGKRN